MCIRSKCHTILAQSHETNPKEVVITVLVVIKKILDIVDMKEENGFAEKRYEYLKAE